MYNILYIWLFDVLYMISCLCTFSFIFFFFSFAVIAMNKTNYKSGSEEVGIGDFDEDDINHDFDPIGKK